MKYEKCLKCDQLGTTCDGPNLLSMDTVELGLWCNELRKDNPGMTYDRIAAETELSKSAVRDFLTGKHDDCSMRTARTLAKHITNGKWDDNPCGNISNEERAGYEDRIRQLEEGIAWRDDRIQHLTTNYNDLTTLVSNTNKRNEDQTKFLQKAIGNKNKTILTLAISLAVCLLVIIIALAVDFVDGNIGFFRQ